MRILHVATTNANKLRELRQMLEPIGYQVLGIHDLDIPVDEIVEDGATFADNAVIKARAVVQATGNPTVADDSGLVVDALGGRPGVHSARYAGVVGPNRDSANRIKLLRELQGVADRERTARFVCAIAYVAPNLQPRIFEGVLEGVIGHEERGQNGFGYDPIFLIPHDGRTTAQLSPAEKNAISHRGQAIRKLVELLQATP